MDVFREPFDPSDVNDYEVDFTRLLAAGETIGAFAVTPSPAAAEIGFGIREGTYSPTAIGGTAVRFWPTIAAEEASHARWAGAGLRCVLEITITTTATPPRTLQRRCAVIVRQM
ncbi:MAG: hypothetical protein J0I69_02680 [Altererythrobacter sp.]|nr:hypothetical protein [Altererythrobacter sp.]OJU60925.1 MAG: hypothetical protein BGO08_12430 [Altererythrobacter sp. 66-12]